MITQQSAGGFEQHITQKTQEFQMQHSAAAFKILSSGLYSNKIRSILRELCSNAYDSHVAAGCADKPFEVTLPTYGADIFKIRDFGTGLSDTDVFGLYTTYFASTKANSNDYVGAKGLGSKTPFCYTDTFTVTSWHNGNKSIFLVFVGKQGVPEITKVHGEKTTEPNGLEVSFSTDINDASEFAKDAKEVFQWFDVAPACNIDLKVRSIVDDETFRTNSVIGIRVVDFAYRWYAKMGPVAYPVNISKLPFDEADDVIKWAHRSSGVLNLAIGDIEVTASREDIEYVEVTKSNLLAALRSAYDECVEVVNRELATATTEFERRCKIAKLQMHNSSLISNIARKIQSKYSALIGNNQFTNAHYKITRIPANVRVDCDPSDLRKIHTVDGVVGVPTQFAHEVESLSLENRPVVILDDTDLSKPTTNVTKRQMIYAAQFAHKSTTGHNKVFVIPCKDPGANAEADICALFEGIPPSCIVYRSAIPKNLKTSMPDNRKISVTELCLIHDRQHQCYMDYRSNVKILASDTTARRVVLGSQLSKIASKFGTTTHSLSADSVVYIAALLGIVKDGDRVITLSDAQRRVSKMSCIDLVEEVIQFVNDPNNAATVADANKLILDAVCVDDGAASYTDKQLINFIAKYDTSLDSKSEYRIVSNYLNSQTLISNAARSVVQDGISSLTGQCVTATAVPVQQCIDRIPVDYPMLQHIKLHHIAPEEISHYFELIAKGKK